MHRLDVVAWVLSVAGDLRLSQAKTLAELVAAAVGVGRATLSAIGRQVAGPAAAKHRIKRVWRFCANRRGGGSGGVGGGVDRPTPPRHKTLLVGPDSGEGRCLPPLGAAPPRPGPAGAAG